MKRRTFNKSILANIIGLIALRKKTGVGAGEVQERIDEIREKANKTEQRYIERLYGNYPIGIALEDIPKDEYGWVKIF